MPDNIKPRLNMELTEEQDKALHAEGIKYGGIKDLISGLIDLSIPYLERNPLAFIYALNAGLVQISVDIDEFKLEVTANAPTRPKA